MLRVVTLGLLDRGIQVVIYGCSGSVILDCNWGGVFDRPLGIQKGGRSTRPMYRQFLYGSSKSFGSKSLHLAEQRSSWANFGLIRCCVKIFGFGLLRDKEGDYTEERLDDHCFIMLSGAEA
jgi:hypothetical protein